LPAQSAPAAPGLFRRTLQKPRECAKYSPRFLVYLPKNFPMPRPAEIIEGTRLTSGRILRYNLLVLWGITEEKTGI
jgi:hypothetical protein